jgi:AraC-like DNA-binding protein
MALTNVDITSIIAFIIKIIIYAGIVQGLYAAMVLTHTKLKNPANLYLAILLLVLSFSIFHSTVIIPYFNQFHKISFQFKEPFLLLVVPLIWLYVKKLDKPEFQFKSKHLLHFAPFLIVMSFSLLFLTHNSNNQTQDDFNSHAIILGILIYILTFGQYLFYLYYIFQLIGNFKLKALNELSNTENIDPAWLRIFLVTFIAVFILLIVMMVIAIHKIDAKYFNNIIAVIFALTIYVLGYKGLFQQTIQIDVTKDSIEGDLKINKNISEPKVDAQVLKRLLDYMQQSKPYHDSNLTLTSLASQINISRNQLSEIINSGTGGNFYDFINKYRVDDVKDMMVNIKYKDYTILAIAFEAGFPSKSTFNSIFKKHTGLTPSGYKSGLL